MTEENRNDDDKAREAGPEEGERKVAPERRDDDGLPIDRAPTLDDVRGGGGSGRTTAVSCTLAVVLLLAAFWVLRVVVMR